MEKNKIHEDLLMAIKEQNESLLKALKTLEESIIQLKKDNTIMKYVLKEMLHIPDDVYK
jgi:hypothetical protein